MTIHFDQIFSSGLCVGQLRLSYVTRIGDLGDSGVLSDSVSPARCFIEYKLIQYANLTLTTPKILVFIGFETEERFVTGSPADGNSCQKTVFGNFVMADDKVTLLTCLSKRPIVTPYWSGSFACPSFRSYSGSHFSNTAERTMAPFRFRHERGKRIKN